MLRELLEVEEVVGRAWHRWAASAASWPDHPDAAVTLESLAGALGVFFRATGGDPGATIDALADRGSSHRLRLRQRLGLVHEAVPTGRLDEEALLLAPRLALFPERALNRLHYFWLAAQAACLPRPRHASDPLQQDLLDLYAADAAARAACARLPGLGPAYRRLCEGLLNARPERRLPPAEQAVESLLREALGAASQRLPPRATDWRSDCKAFLRGERETLCAPGGYRPPLPVPLWVMPAPATVAATPRAAVPEEPVAAEAAVDAASPGRRKAERRRQDLAERDDPLVFNRFEKLLSMAEMVNVNRLVDDELDENAARHAEQLEEITLSPHEQRAATRLKVELDLPRDEPVGERLAEALAYPEWHYRKQRELPDHCAVIDAIAPETSDAGWEPDAALARRIRRVRRQFEALRPERQCQRGQVDGPELDLDAVVRAIADQRAGNTGSDRVFMEHREQERDLAVSALIDVSLSTEAWLEGRRVIDLEKEALLVLAHGIAACGDALAISSFTSRRREQVWIRRVKNWDEPLNHRVEARIAALEPGSYTRMGAALRHVSAGLAARPQRHRLLLLLTDGKPNDTDYYEGRYAIEDTRHAVRDARRQGIRVFAVTIDSEARQYLPRIFGQAGYSIVYHPLQLVAALPAIYRELTTGH